MQYLLLKKTSICKEAVEFNKIRVILIDPVLIRILDDGSGVHFCGIGLQGRESEHSGRGSKGARAGGGR